MKKKTTKRNPQDTTLRNVRAANRKIADLRRDVRSLQHDHETLFRLVAQLQQHAPSEPTS